MATTAIKLPKALQTATEKLARYAELSQQVDTLNAERKPLLEEQEQIRQELQAWADSPANQKHFANGMTVRVDAGKFGYQNSAEKLGWNLEAALSDAEARAAAVVAAVSKILPSAVKTTYDEKAIVKAWPIMPTLQKKLAKLGITGPTRDKQFCITLDKTAK